MQRLIRRKWRPSLALVIGFTLAGVLALPTIGLFVLFDLQKAIGWTTARNAIAVAIVLATGAIGYVLWRTIMRPVQALSRFANETPAEQPRHFGTTELAHLGQSVLSMRNRLENRETGLRAYTDHVTHELRSPLTSILGATELMQDLGDPATRQELAHTITTAALRMQRLLDDLQALANAKDPRGKGPSSLRQSTGKLSALEIKVTGPDQIPLPQEALDAVLAHLVQNAARHGATQVSVAASSQSVRISDDGRGIAPGDMTRVFEPFFTTARDTGGTGMGLAIVRALLEANGAAIDVLAETYGATFEIRFPEAD